MNKENKKRPVVTARTWSLTIYNIEPFDLIIYMAKIERIKHYAFILHDKDVYLEGETDNEELIGTLKKKHIHLLVNLSSPSTLKWLEGVIYTSNHIEGTLIGEKVNNKFMMFRYLTHKDNTEKYQYCDKEVLTDNKQFWDNTADERSDEIEDMLNSIINKVPLRQLAKRYGKDFIKNYKAYMQFASDVYYQEHNILFYYFENTLYKGEIKNES